MDEATGQPVSGASIVVSQHADYDGAGGFDSYSGIAGGDGSFSITVSGNPTDFWDVVVICPGYEPFYGESLFQRRLYDSLPLPMTFPLKASADHIPVTVTVLDAPGGDPVPGARVTATMGVPYPVGVTNSSGSCSVLLRAGDGRFVLGVDHPSYVSEPSIVSLDGEAPYALTLCVGDPARQFHGTAKSSSGVPLSGVFKLDFVNAQSASVHAGLTMTDGSAGYSVLLPDGEYAAVVHGSGRVYVESVVIDSSTTDPLDLVFEEQLDPSASIEGQTVQDGGQEPLPGVRLLLVRRVHGREFAHSEATSDAAGHYAFTDLPSGIYDVTCGLFSAHVFTTRNMIVEEQDEIVLDDWSPGLSSVASSGSSSLGTFEISGAVKDRSGEPVAGAVIRLNDAGSCSLIARQATDESGMFVFAGLGDGSYSIDVEPAMLGEELCLGLDGRQIVNISGSDVTTPDLRLLPGRALFIAVFCLDESEDAVYLADATVELAEGEELVACGTTDPQGIVVFGHLDEGEYTLTIAKAGYVTRVVDVSVSASLASLVFGFGYKYVAVGIETE